MRYRGQIFMLPTSAIEATGAFYRDVLGFSEVASRQEAGRLEWIRLKADRAQLMFYDPAALGDAPVEVNAPESMVVYLQVEGLEGLHAELEAAGQAVSNVRATFYGMTEFDLRDPNGYTLTFGESLARDA